MLVEAIAASLVLATVVIGWFLVQRWADSVTYPEECNLPPSECRHCMSRNTCLLHTSAEDVEDSGGDER